MLMKTRLIIIPVLLFLASCFKPETSEHELYELKFTFEMGSTTQNPPIYVFWLENKKMKFIQNLKICKRLINGGLTGTALPYWKMNIYPDSDKKEIDAVTSATKKNHDFSFSVQLKNPEIRQFTAYCEIDRSFDKNDWFENQPALLYAAEIDLDSEEGEFELIPVGWTPNELTENIIPGTQKGILQRDIRYITNLKTDSEFGNTDTENQALNMVKKISLKFTR